MITTYNSDAMPTTENILFEKIPVTKRTNAGAYGIRTLDIHYKFIEKHNSDLLKSGIIHLDTKAENLGFSRQISGFDSLQDMEKEMDDLFPAGGPADFLAHPHRRQDQQMVLLHFLPRPSGPHRPGEIFGFDCIKKRE